MSSALDLSSSFAQQVKDRDISQKHFNGLVQDCSNSIANALELLQSCTEPSI